MIFQSVALMLHCNAIGALHFEKSSIIWQKVKRSLVQLALKTHFSTASGYLKIRFQLADLSTTRYLGLTLTTLMESAEALSNFPKSPFLWLIPGTQFVTN